MAEQQEVMEAAMLLSHMIKVAPTNTLFAFQVISLASFEIVMNVKYLCLINKPCGLKPGQH